MKEKTDQRRIRGVTLGIDPACMSSGFMQYVVDLTALLETDLTGLYIENEQVLGLARLSAARQISIVDAAARACSYTEMQDVFREREKYYRQLLQEMASRSGIAWKFDTVRGQISDTVLGLEVESQLVIVPGGSFHPMALPADNISGIYDITLLLHGASEQAERSLQIIRAISGIVPTTRLRVLTMDEDAMLIARNRLSGINAITLHRHFDMIPQNVLENLILDKPSLLVMPYLEDMIAGNDGLKELLRKLSYPVMLVK